MKSLRASFASASHPNAFAFRFTMRHVAGFMVLLRFAGASVSQPLERHRLPVSAWRKSSRSCLQATLGKSRVLGRSLKHRSPLKTMSDCIRWPFFERPNELIMFCACLVHVLTSPSREFGSHFSIRCHAPRLVMSGPSKSLRVLETWTPSCAMWAV